MILKRVNSSNLWKVLKNEGKRKKWRFVIKLTLIILLKVTFRQKINILETVQCWIGRGFGLQQFYYILYTETNVKILKKSSRPCKIFLIYQWTKFVESVLICAEDMNRIWTFLTLSRNIIQHKLSSLQNDDSILRLGRGIGYTVHTCVKTRWPVQFRFVHLTVCKIYFDNK